MARARIVVVAGLEKSGSGWLQNLVEVLVVRGAEGSPIADVRHGALGPLARRAVNADGLTGPLTAARVGALALLGVTGRPFVVKTHQPATAALGTALRTGLAAAVCSIRDPRDLALSALDHAVSRPASNLAREMGSPTIANALHFAARVCEREYFSWVHAPRTCIVRYEDLRAQPARELARVATHLGVHADPELVATAVERWPAGAGNRAGGDNMHFNRGEAARHRHELTGADRRLADRVLGRYVDAMGYTTAEVA